MGNDLQNHQTRGVILIVIPLLFGVALFTSIYSLNRVATEYSTRSVNDTKRMAIETTIIFLILSIFVSLFLRNEHLLPISFFSLLSLSFLQKRRKQIQFKRQLNREIFFLALSLSLLIEAGCSIQSAIEKLHASFPKSPSKSLLGDMKSLFEIGVDTDKGVREISQAYKSEKADLMLEMLLTGKTLGRGPGKALKQLSEKMISDRVIEAEERALKAPVKLMVPLCIFIFPAIFLLIFSPIILQLESLF